MRRTTCRRAAVLALALAAARSRGEALAADPPASAARIADAHADRVVILPTAYTHPEGTLYFSSYDLAGLQAGYAVSDTVQLTLTGTPPFGKDHIFPLDVSVKAALLGQARVRAAVVGSASGIVGFEGSAAFVGRAGAVMQLCFEDDCGASVSVGTTMLFAGQALLMADGVGLIWPLSRVFSVLLEVDSLVPFGRDVGEYHGVAAAPGARFRARNWAIDLALATPLDVEGSPPVIPLLAATYRFLP